MNEAMIDPRKAIESFGDRIFSVTFIKRTNGEIRQMLCRRGVTLGQNHPNSSEHHRQDRDGDLLTVFDIQKRQYRRIPLDAVLNIAGTPQETLPSHRQTSSRR